MRFNTPPYENNISKVSKDNIGQKNNLLTEEWENYFSVQNNLLNENLSDNGYIFPAINETKKGQISKDYKQSIVYNSDKTRMEINNGNREDQQDNGDYEPIQTYGAKTTSQIAQEAIKPKNLGKIFVNSDTNELQFSIDGVTVRTISSM